MDSNENAQRSYRYPCLNALQVNNMTQQQIERDLGIQLGIMEQEQIQTPFLQQTRSIQPLPGLNYRPSYEYENQYFGVNQNQQLVPEYDQDDYDQDIDQQEAPRYDNIETIINQNSQQQPSIISRQNLDQDFQSDQQQNLRIRESPNGKKDRYDNNMQKMISRVGKNAVKDMKSINSKKILKFPQIKKIQKRGYIHILLAFIQSQGGQKAIEQFIQRYSELKDQKINQINEKSEQKPAKKKFQIQSLQKSFDAVIEYANGQHERSIYKMYVIQQGGSIKKINQYEKGKQQIQKLRVKKLKLKALQFKKMQ